MNAEQIKNLRERLGMTQEQFANKLQCNRRTVVRWEASEKCCIEISWLLTNRLQDLIYQCDKSRSIYVT